MNSIKIQICEQLKGAFLIFIQQRTQQQQKWIRLQNTTNNKRPKSINVNGLIAKKSVTKVNLLYLSLIWLRTSFHSSKRKEGDRFSPFFWRHQKIIRLKIEINCFVQQCKEILRIVFLGRILLQISYSFHSRTFDFFG